MRRSDALPEQAVHTDPRSVMPPRFKPRYKYDLISISRCLDWN